MEKAGGSRPSRGSMRSWRNGIRASLRCWWFARAMQVQILSSARCPCSSGWPERWLCKLTAAGSSPAHACLVVMAARRLGKALVGVQLSEQAPRGCSSGVRASPCQGEGPGFKSWQPLAIDYGAVDQLAGVTPFRSADVRVRIPVALRSEAGRSRPHRFACTGRARVSSSTASRSVGSAATALPC
jgi:hypothetical protein